MDSGWVTSDCLLLRVSDLSADLAMLVKKVRRYEGSGFEGFVGQQHPTPRHGRLMKIKRYSDKLVRTQLLRLVVFPSDLTKLFLQVVLADKHDTSGQFQNRVDLSRLEVSFLTNNSRFCLTLSFEKLRPCANTELYKLGEVHNGGTKEELMPAVLRHWNRQFWWGWNPCRSLLLFDSEQSQDLELLSAPLGRRGEGSWSGWGQRGDNISDWQARELNQLRHLITVSAANNKKYRLLSLLLLPPFTFVTQ